MTGHWRRQCQTCLTVLPQAPGAPDFVAHQVTELPVIHRRITEHRLSRRETSGVMGQVSGVPISIGSVDALCKATGESLGPVTAALVATLP